MPARESSHQPANGPRLPLVRRGNACPGPPAIPKWSALLPHLVLRAPCCERPASFAACFFQVAREARVLSLPQPRVRRFHRSASAFRQIVLPVLGYVSAGARPTPCAIPCALFRAHAARRSCVVACGPVRPGCDANRSEEHTSELQSQSNLVCRLL